MRTLTLSHDSVAALNYVSAASALLVSHNRQGVLQLESLKQETAKIKQQLAVVEKAALDEEWERNGG